MAPGEQPLSAVVLKTESETAHVGGHKRSRSGTEDAGYNSAGSAPYGQQQDQVNANDGPKKRKTAAGSRGVAHLTPEQLEKKRANDREAQRAIRERTKSQIDSLQRELHELRSQQPQLELQAALRAKEDVEAELLDVKRRLASVISMIQPIVSGSANPSPYHSYNLTASQRPVPPSLNSASAPPSTSAPSPALGASIQSGGPWLQQNDGLGSSCPRGPTPPPPVPQPQQQHCPQAKLHGFDFRAERLGVDFLLDHPTQRVAQVQTGLNSAQDSPHSAHVPMKHDWAASAIKRQEGPSRSQTTTTHLIGGGPPRSSSFSPQIDPSLQDTNTYAGFSTSVKNCPPSNPLDRLLLDFLQERHQRAAEGICPAEIIGPRYPSLSSLLDPSVTRFSHPLSKVFTDILQTFPDLSTLPERVAVLLIMFLIMRWQICPTKENYDRLPDWAKPRPSQLFTPHPAWMDHLPFPRMREKLMRDYYGPSRQQPEDIFPFENFFIPYTTTLSLNWPYEDVDVLLQTPDTEELMINPVFERHLRRLDNWTLGESFAQAFPGLVETFNLKSEDRGIKLAK